MCDYITDKTFYIYAIYFDKFGLPQFLARPAIVWPHVYKNDSTIKVFIISVTKLSGLYVGSKISGKGPIANCYLKVCSRFSAHSISLTKRIVST